MLILSCIRRYTTRPPQREQANRSAVFVFVSDPTKTAVSRVSSPLALSSFANHGELNAVHIVQIMLSRKVRLNYDKYTNYGKIQGIPSSRMMFVYKP